MKVFESSTRRASPPPAKWPPAQRSRQPISPSMAEGSEDPRWMLVQRIVASSYFRRSTLLINFLLFVCDRYLSGQTSEINEKQIGFHVFGRGEGYNASDDNIVRNYARTLRKRLDEFFSGEGKHEALTLFIPRGGYVPVFAPRENEPAPSGHDLVSNDKARSSTEPSDGEVAIGFTDRPPHSSDERLETNLVERTAEDVATGHRTSADLSKHDSATAVTSDLKPGRSPARTANWNLRPVYLLAAVCTIVLSALAGYIGAHGLPVAWRETSTTRISHAFWDQMFDQKRDTFIVPADGGLVMLQSFIREHVSLEDYANRRYLRESSIVQGIAGLTQSRNTDDLSRLQRKVETIGARRYTSIVDLELTTRFARLKEVVPERLMIRYARDLRMDDLRSGNAILIGSSDANPWVELFQRQLNFRFSTGADFGGSGIITNQHPLNGERATYASEPNDPLLRTYGVIAYVPNLDGTGHTLLIEGVNMAGTQAAGDFLLDAAQMQSVLERAKGPNGIIGPFEVLIETDNIAASSSRPHVISERIGLL